MKKKIKISCLPVAGIENPYQYLMIQGLREDKGLSVQNGIDDRFFGILRTAAIQRPNYIHFDWETSYYYRRSLWMTVLNIPFFILQLYIARYIFKCKLVWTPHNIIPHDVKNLSFHRFCRRFFTSQMKWIRLFSETSIPQALKEFKCDVEKFKIIPEGSYVQYYPNTVSRYEARCLLKIPPDMKVILYIGFIKPYKGIIDLIRCFKKVKDKNAFLIIAGKVVDTEYFEAMKEMVNDKILLVNRFVENNELQYYFNAADVVALPFKKIENSGSVILAMGFKKAVVAPRMGVVAERLENQTELLYSDFLEQSLKILEDYSNKKLEEIGEKNFHTLEKYSWGDFAKAFYN